MNKIQIWLNNYNNIIYTHNDRSMTLIYDVRPFAHFSKTKINQFLPEKTNKNYNYFAEYRGLLEI